MNANQAAAEDDNNAQQQQRMQHVDQSASADPPKYPGQNLSPQLQAEGESFVEEIMQYLLADVTSPDQLDHLINRPTRRQQGK